MLGTTVGGYEVIHKIAEGGMGAVYRAQHKLIGKAAAIKVILPELSANQELVNRFFNEARAASTIHHPGIVEVYDFGYLPSGLAFIVMEFLEGEPLTRRILARGRLDERSALTILRASAGALAAAHAKGIVHRDLKPDNIYLVPDPDVIGGERPKLLDFGIAKLTDASGGSVGQTRSGAMMGTPAYMSPEQCRGAGDVDHRSDIYALGCILYEMLTGRTPFISESVGELIAAHLMFEPVPPRKLVPDLSLSTEALVLQLLAKRPEDRVQSATELAKMLGQGSIPHLAEGGHLPMAPMVPIAPTSPRVPTGSSVSMQPSAGPGASSMAAVMAQAGSPAGGPTPTTLSSAASPRTVDEAADEVVGQRRSRTGLYAALGAFAVVGGLVAVVLSGGGGKGKDTAGAGATVPPAVVATPAPVVATPDAGVAAVVPTLDAGAAIAITPAALPDAGAASAGTTDVAVGVAGPATTGKAGAGKTGAGKAGAGKAGAGKAGAGKTGAGKTGAGKTGAGSGSSTIVPIETEI